MTQAFRIESDGLINRDKKLSFKFNGKTYIGIPGWPEFAFWTASIDKNLIALANSLLVLFKFRPM